MCDSDVLPLLKVELLTGPVQRSLSYRRGCGSSDKPYSANSARIDPRNAKMINEVKAREIRRFISA